MSATALLAVKIVGDGTSAQSALDKTGKSASSFSSKAVSAGKVAGKVLAVGLLAAGAAAISATKAAAADELAQSKLASVLKGAAGATDAQVAATESWIAAQGKALGVSDDELRPSLAKLVAATKDVGKAQKLAALAMDISAASGKSLDSVSAALAKAQTGSVGGLAKYGVATKTAAGETKSLQAIQLDLANTYSGAAAKAAETAAGKQAILEVQMGELQETIGARLLPVMLALVDVGLKVVDWITQNQTVAGILLGTLGGLLLTVFLVGKAIAAWSTIVKIATGVQAVWNAVMSANPIALVVIALVALVAGFILAYKKSATFRAIVQGTMDVAGKAIRAVVKIVGDLVSWIGAKVPGAIKVLRTIAVTYFKIAFAPLLLAIKVAGVLVGWLRDNIPGAFAILRSKAVSAVAGVIERIQAIIAKAREVINWIGQRVGGAFDALVRQVTGPIESIQSGIQGLIDLIQTLIGWIGDIDFPEPPGWIKDVGGSVGDVFSKGATVLSRSTSSSTVPAIPVGDTNVYITVQGAVDPYSTATQIRELLEREARWRGKVVTT